ncbi:MAG: hypothetical protein C0597_15025 [Marinilabiliales bacterium]|nr:MAG: hypothetical protein C0597_15025 [Marinilabiliales bacterium]
MEERIRYIILVIKLKPTIMSKRKKTGVVFVPFVLSIATYVVFFNDIKSKPDEAGFWMIIAIGISLGLIIRSMVKK